MKNFKQVALSLAFLSLFVGCQDKRDVSTLSLHPHIDPLLQELAQNKTLEFGTLVKNDGQYCYVSYEGFLRTQAELQMTTQKLQQLISSIELVLANEFSNTEKVQLDNKQLQNKAELACLRDISKRQIAKYHDRSVKKSLASN